MPEPLLETQMSIYLKAQGFGNLGTDPTGPRVIYTGEVPQISNERLIVLQENGGAPAPQVVSQERNITIQVFDEDAVAGRTTAQEILRLLDNSQGILEPEILVARVTADSNPIPLGRDNNRRHIFSTSYTLLVKPLTPS